MCLVSIPQPVNTFLGTAEEGPQAIQNRTETRQWRKHAGAQRINGGLSTSMVAQPAALPFLSLHLQSRAGLSRLPWVTTSGNILGSPLRVVPSGQAAWGGGAGQSKNPAACSRCHSRANAHPSRRCPGLGSLSWRGHLTACSISEAAKRRVRVKGALPNLSLSLPTGTQLLAI